MQAHIGEHTATAEMASTADEQQHQRHHQLSPAAPPTLLLTGLLQALKLTLWIAQMTRESKGRQAVQQGFCRCGGLEFHPSRTAEQIDAGLLHPGLGAQAFFHSADAAAALHAFDIKK